MFAKEYPTIAVDGCRPGCLLALFPPFFRGHENAANFGKLAVKQKTPTPQW